MNHPIETNFSPSERPSYLARLDDALLHRNELVEMITSAFQTSQEHLPTAVKKQLDELQQCNSSEKFLASSTLASLLPIVMSFRSSESREVIEWLRNYIALHTAKRFGLIRFWTYPMILASLLVFLLFAQAWVVSPVFEEMFSDFGLRLPTPTMFLFWFNRSIRDYLPIVVAISVLVMASLFFLKRLLRRFAETHQHWQTVHWLTNGSNANLIAMHHFVGTLAASMELGMPQSHAYQIAGTASARPFFREQTTILGDSTSLQAWDRFPAMLRNIMRSSVGESDKVRALYSLSEVYRDRVLLRKRKSISAVQPFVILAIGALIGFIAISLFMPLFSLITALS